MFILCSILMTIVKPLCGIKYRDGGKFELAVGVIVRRYRGDYAMA